MRALLVLSAAAVYIQAVKDGNPPPAAVHRVLNGFDNPSCAQDHVGRRCRYFCVTRCLLARGPPVHMMRASTNTAPHHFHKYERTNGKKPKNDNMACLKRGSKFSRIFGCSDTIFARAHHCLSQHCRLHAKFSGCR